MSTTKSTFIVIFTIKNSVQAFRETVEADSVDQAKEAVKEIVKSAGLKLKHITAVIETECDSVREQ